MSNILNLRSPFYNRVSEQDLDRAVLSIYIYSGAYKTTPPETDLKYTIQKSSGVVGNDVVVFEISELVRDYLDITYDGEYDSQCVWVRLKTETYDTSSKMGEYTANLIAFDGYGYHEEGLTEISTGTAKEIGPEFDKGLMMSPATLYRINDRSINIPVNAETTNSVAFRLNGETVYSETISDDNNTNQKIQYIASDGNSTADSYRERVLEDGGVFEENSLLDAFEDEIDIGEVDEVWVNYTKDSLDKTHILKVKTFDCSRYEPIRVTFVNKYGALQDFYFTKRSNESIDVKTDSYKSSLMSFANGTASYDVTRHQKRALNLVGNESITLNTDYIDESCNEHIKQLMLSEQIWMTRLTDEEKVVPLTLRSSSNQFKTGVNDRLVQYTMRFDVAVDKINNIR